MRPIAMVHMLSGKAVGAHFIFDAALNAAMSSTLLCQYNLINQIATIMLK